MGAIIRYDESNWEKIDLRIPGEERGERSMKIRRFLNDTREKLDAETRKAAYAEGKARGNYDYDFAIGQRMAIPEELLPNELTIKSNTTIPDLYSNGGFVFVSEAFKEAIENFDPGIHQFAAIKIVDSSGQEYEKTQFYFFKCRQVLNAIDDTGVDLHFPGAKPTGNGDPVPYQPLPGLRYRMFKDVIGSAGIWTELRHYHGIHASDAFMALAKSRGLTGIEIFQEFDEV